jgi:hypothetical protein
VTIIASIKTRASQATFGRDLWVWIISAAPLLAGWLIGFVARIIKIIVAAFVEGYQRGAKVG